MVYIKAVLVKHPKNMLPGMPPFLFGSTSPISTGEEACASLSDLVFMSDEALSAVIAITSDVADMACEYQDCMSVVQLFSLLDLYRTYLDSVKEYRAADDSSFEHHVRSGGGTVTFNHFIRDRRLLAIAAKAAEQECGSAVATPQPAPPYTRVSVGADGRYAVRGSA